MFNSIKNKLALALITSIFLLVFNVQYQIYTDQNQLSYLQNGKVLGRHY